MACKHLKWWLLCGGILLAVLLAVAYHQWRYPNVFIDPSRYPVRGIDVSHHNGRIDWNAVAATGVEFTFVKATEGTSFVDHHFKTNVRKAREAGLKVGVYHFFRMNTDGTKQANHFLKQIKGLPLDLPLVIDVEVSGQKSVPKPQAVSQQLKRMVDALQACGFDVIVYTNLTGYRDYCQPCCGNLPLWVCATRQPELLTGKRHVFQQYSHWGSVDGIDGDVDMNIFNGSRDQWNHWLDSVKTPQY